MPVLLRLCLLATMLCACAGAEAAFHPVAPGQSPRLGAEEGLLLLDLDADEPLYALRLQRWRGQASAVLRDLPAGLTHALYVVKAGDYQIDRLRMPHRSGQFRLDKDPEFRLHVEAGVLNYPGDLLFRRAGRGHAAIRLVNRGLAAMDWFEANWPALSAQVRFVYRGHYPDPFPPFYAAVRRAHPGADGKAVRSAPAAPPFPLRIEDLWRPQRIRRVALDAGGTRLAELVREDGRDRLDLIDLTAHRSTRLAELDAPVVYLSWLSPRRLLLGLGESEQSYRLVVLGLDGADGTPQVSRWNLGGSGSVVRELGASEHVLFAYRRGRSLCVRELDLADTHAPDEGARSGCLNRGVKDDRYWFADQAGTLRAAVVERADGGALLYGEPGRYRVVLSPADGIDFVPLALSPDGSLFYGRSEAGRGQRDLVVFDPRRRAIVATLFSQAGVDTEGLLLDGAGRPLGATYFSDGLRVSAYFDADERTLAARVEAAFPGQSAAVLDRDDSGRSVILGVEGGARPLALYRLDTRSGSTELLDEGMPWLTSAQLGATHALKATATDGVPLEAYLTLPPGDSHGPFPLVVMPHGGPIGVRDVVRFDPEVQLVASLGYAVLRVNFRGSEGFGSAFRDAGRGQFGDQIENDVDSVLQVAWRTFPLDPTRSCTVGTSYGGYSALISAVRWPDRFRCVVSIMGVSDRPLVFTASDAGSNAEGRRQLEAIMGDPATQTEELVQRSPLYRYAALEDVPLMLVHGEEDARVDFEHTRRLSRLLALAGRPPIVIALPDTGHEPFKAADRARVWGAIAGFLREHLGERAGSLHTAAPGISWPTATR